MLLKREIEIQVLNYLWPRMKIWSLIKSVMIALALCSSLTALAEYGWPIHQRAEEIEQDCQHKILMKGLNFVKNGKIQIVERLVASFLRTNYIVLPRKRRVRSKVWVHLTCFLVTCVQISKSIWNIINNKTNYTGQNQYSIGLSYCPVANIRKASVDSPRAYIYILYNYLSALAAYLPRLEKSRSQF